MLDDSILDKLSAKIKKIRNIEKFDDIKILIDTDNKLADEVTLKNVVTLMQWYVMHYKMQWYVLSTNAFRRAINSIELCDKIVSEECLTLIFIPDWFVTNKMLQKLDDVLFLGIVFNDVDSDIVTFFSHGMGLVTTANINLEDDHCDKYCFIVTNGLV